MNETDRHRVIELIKDYDFEKAEAILKEPCSRKDPEAYYMLGRVFYRDEIFSKSITAYAQAVALAPSIDDEKNRKSFIRACEYAMIEAGTRGAFIKGLVDLAKRNFELETDDPVTMAKIQDRCSIPELGIPPLMSRSQLNMRDHFGRAKNPEELRQYMDKLASTGVHDAQVAHAQNLESGIYGQTDIVNAAELYVRASFVAIPYKNLSKHEFNRRSSSTIWGKEGIRRLMPSYSAQAAFVNLVRVNMHLTEARAATAASASPDLGKIS